MLHDREQGLKERERMLSISQENLKTITDLEIKRRMQEMEEVSLIKISWVKVFRAVPEFRILRLTFQRKSASKC